MIVDRPCDAYARLYRERAEAELYGDSDCNVIFTDAAGTIHTLPVVLRKSTIAADGYGDYFVFFGGQYIEPKRLPGFLRLELKPEARRKPAESGPATYSDACRAREQEAISMLAARQQAHRSTPIPNHTGDDRQARFEKLAEMERELLSQVARNRLKSRGRS